MNERFIQSMTDRAAIIDIIEHTDSVRYEFVEACSDEAYLTPAHEPLFTQRRLHPSVLRVKMLQAEKASQRASGSDIKWQDATKPIEIGPAPKNVTRDSGDMSLKHALRGTVRRLTGMSSFDERAHFIEARAGEERERLINKIIEDNFTSPVITQDTDSIIDE